MHVHHRRFPETVMVSAIEPSFISALTVAVNDVGSSTPFRSNVENPGNMNVTLYVPGRRSTIRYTPWLSVTAVGPARSAQDS